MLGLPKFWVFHLQRFGHLSTFYSEEACGRREASCELKVFALGSKGKENADMSSYSGRPLIHNI